MRIASGVAEGGVLYLAATNPWKMALAETGYDAASLYGEYNEFLSTIENSAVGRVGFGVEDKAGLGLDVKVYSGTDYALGVSVKSPFLEKSMTNIHNQGQKSNVSQHYRWKAKEDLINLELPVQHTIFEIDRANSAYTNKLGSRSAFDFNTGMRFNATTNSYSAAANAKIKFNTKLWGFQPYVVVEGRYSDGRD